VDELNCGTKSVATSTIDGVGGRGRSAKCVELVDEAEIERSGIVSSKLLVVVMLTCKRGRPTVKGCSLNWEDEGVKDIVDEDVMERGGSLSS